MIAIPQTHQAYSDTAYGGGGAPGRPKRKSLLNILTNAMKRRSSSPSSSSSSLPPSPTTPTTPKAVLSLLQSGKLHTLSIELDPSHRHTPIGPFPSVLSLTITFLNFPSLSDLASALTDFPHIRSLALHASSTSLARGPAPAVHGLSSLCPHLKEVRMLGGWNGVVGEWAARTSGGVEVLEVCDLIGTGREGKGKGMQETVQVLLDVNAETLRAVKICTFYQVHIDLHRLTHLSHLQLSVSPTNGGASSAEAIVKTIRLWQPCHTQFIRLALVDQDGKQVDPGFAEVSSGMRIVEVPLPEARGY